MKKKKFKPMSRGFLNSFWCNSKLMPLVLVTLSGLLLSAQARADCEQPVGRFVDINGSVETQTVDGDDWLKANLETPLCEGSSIRVGAQSRAAINLVNDAVLRLDENTTMRLVDVNEEEQERSLLDVIKGALNRKNYPLIPPISTVLSKVPSLFFGFPMSSRK
jgi:hypothetical protein